MIRLETSKSYRNGYRAGKICHHFKSLLLLLAALTLSTHSFAADVIVYKSPTCGCCNDWVKHLQQNGFSVQTHDRRDMQLVKRTLNVPQGLQSCHTAVVGDYVVEGHVPAKEIVRLLREKPAVEGISVPGMPMGSPGMEGPRRDNYDVLIFDGKGNTEVYSRY
ncbi:MAG: DUF411 domain-containing protein [Candidatus Thiodiazotropha endolucinida]|nr:DUF411 domain-containing protein [Candidatus Thiodiazotropha taylori]MCG8096972.1 DUF411 domain-containing protein [Candidatus Thiodiazotropha endolucinida]MCG8061618.1 DUF411 domain-containing protein [Candidatus Thiodiazotropha taylori]MCG8063756.1 DUF411 domain-containing protein [Candidatus Thiodiazotropha taylori]MCW4329841.1 DUF411 domain-containing protein [Candidatus Thiodiazotropha endolucinida]